MGLNVLNNLTGLQSSATKITDNPTAVTQPMSQEAPALTISQELGQTGNQPQNKSFSNEKQGKEGQATGKQIKTAITEANNKLRHHMTRCEFSYHEETNRVSIKVIDKETDEVVREIPPEETLEMVQRMWELAGILVDEKR